MRCHPISSSGRSPAGGRTTAGCRRAVSRPHTPSASTSPARSSCRHQGRSDVRPRPLRRGPERHVEGAISGANGIEHPVELWRRRIGLVLAPLVFVALWSAPLALPLPAHRLAAILARGRRLWMTEAIPMAMTAFLGVARGRRVRGGAGRRAFAPFADPLIFLFIGTFMLAQSILFHGLDRRFASRSWRCPAGRRSPSARARGLCGRRLFVSMWISNTATTAMMLPIGLSLLCSAALSATAPACRRRTARRCYSPTAFAASIGGLGTPVGTPPNLIGIGFIRREARVAPVLLVDGARRADRRRAVRVGRRGDPLRGDAGAIRRCPAPWRGCSRQNGTRSGPGRAGQRTRSSRSGRPSSSGCCRACWRSCWANRPPDLSAADRHAARDASWRCSAPALLFILPVDLARHEFTLPWGEAVKIDWWIVFLYGGGIALGTLAFQTGLAEAIGRGLTSLLGVRARSVFCVSQPRSRRCSRRPPATPRRPT